MERLIIQYPTQLLIVWALLTLLHYYLAFAISRLFYKNSIHSEPKFESKYDKKCFLKLALWLAFGVGTLAAFRQAMLDEKVTANEYFVWVGAFFFIIIGYLLRDILCLEEYFVYWKRTPAAVYSFKAAVIVRSFEFFGYAALIFLSFLITKNPILLGGTIGLAFDGILYIFDLTNKKYRSGNN